MFEANEYANELTDAKLKGLLVQLTGEEDNSRVIQLIMSAFKTLKEFCNIDEVLESENDTIRITTTPELNQPPVTVPVEKERGAGLNLSYTINLNLPATSDIAVFDAIFKSLRTNLLKG